MRVSLFRLSTRSRPPTYRSVLDIPLQFATSGILTYNPEQILVSCSHRAMAKKIPCTCGCDTIVTRQTLRSHLQGRGTQTVLVAQQRKIFKLRRLHLERRRQNLRNREHQNGERLINMDRALSGTPSNVQMQEEQDMLMYVPEDESHGTSIHNPASPHTNDPPEPPNHDYNDPMQSHSDRESVQGQGIDVTLSIDDDPSASIDPPFSESHPVVPEQIFQRCRVWPPDGAPAFHPVIDESDARPPVDEDDRNEEEDTPGGGDDDGGNSDSFDSLDEEESPLEPSLQAMSAADELALDFERDVAALGMFSSSADHQ